MKDLWNTEPCYCITKEVSAIFPSYRTSRHHNVTQYLTSSHSHNAQYTPLLYYRLVSCPGLMDSRCCVPSLKLVLALLKLGSLARWCFYVLASWCNRYCCEATYGPLM